MTNSHSHTTENRSQSQPASEPPSLNLEEYGNETGHDSYLELQRHILQSILDVHHRQIGLTP